MSDFFQSPFNLSLTAVFLLIVSLVNIFNAFKKKGTKTLVLGIIIGFGSLITAIISVVKAILQLNILSEIHSTEGKSDLVISLVISGLHLLVFTICEAILVWLFKGYRHGL